MTVETPRLLKRIHYRDLLEIAANIDVPRNKWEQAWYDLAGTVVYTSRN